MNGAGGNLNKAKPAMALSSRRAVLPPSQSPFGYLMKALKARAPT